MAKKLPKVIAIVGPTAVGKSTIAVELAKKFNGEIVSADSRQVYRGLDIGAGKITKKEMAGIPHHLLDVASPKKRFSVVEFKTLAEAKIADILKRGKLPIICGGTGFYISALIDGIVLPNAPVNQKLRNRLEKLSSEKLFLMLKRSDPRRAKTIDPKNKRRLIRAVEITKHLGNVPRIVPKKATWKALRIGLLLPRKETRDRIDARLASRLKQGMLMEAKNLRESGLSWKRLDELGLEYRYMAKYLKKELSQNEMAEKLSTEIWRFSKRQMTWFKRDKKIQWFSPRKTKSIFGTTRAFLN